MLTFGYRQTQDLNTFIAQGITFIFAGLAANRALWRFVVMNPARLIGKRVANILTVTDDSLDKLAIQGGGMFADRHQRRTRRR